MSELNRLIYISEIDKDKLDSEMIAGILHSARKNNPNWGVTGMLVSDYHHFIQVLEGKPGTLEALFRRIQDDDRHHNVNLLENIAVTDRLFGEWSMGFAKLESVESGGAFNAENLNGALALELLTEQARRKGIQTF